MPYKKLLLNFTKKASDKLPNKKANCVANKNQFWKNCNFLSLPREIVFLITQFLSNHKLRCQLASVLLKRIQRLPPWTHPRDLPRLRIPKRHIFYITKIIVHHIQLVFFTSDGRLAEPRRYWNTFHCASYSKGRSNDYCTLSINKDWDPNSETFPMEVYVSNFCSKIPLTAHWFSNDPFNYKFKVSLMLQLDFHKMINIFNTEMWIGRFQISRLLTDLGVSVGLAVGQTKFYHNSALDKYSLTDTYID